MVITVPVPEKVSLNAIYRGIHFRQRHKHKEHWRWALLTLQPQPYQGEYPVACHYHFRLVGNRYDVSNHAYMMKMAEDALVTQGVIPDDTQRYVAAITITAEKLPRGGANEVVIGIEPYTANNARIG